MALSKYTDFSHLARDFFMVTVGCKIYNDDIARFFDVCDSLLIVDYMCFYCDTFRYTFHQEFLSIFRQVEYDDFKTEEQFLRYAIPRCLEIAVPEMYFYSLLLVSAFLTDFVEFLQKTRRCYRFHMIAYKCYVAVFKRDFESSFESHGGMVGLWEYLEENFSTLEGMSIPEERDLQQDVHSPPQARSMIENSRPVHDDFDLNEFERSLLAKELVVEFLGTYSVHDDPLGFEWPIRPEQVLRKLQFMYDDYSQDAEYTDLSRYVFALQLKAEDIMRNHGEDFKEEMRNRMCPCCGVRCWQYSFAILQKQLSLSLKMTPTWQKNLLGFIGRCQERITRLVRFPHLRFIL